MAPHPTAHDDPRQPAWSRAEQFYAARGLPVPAPLTTDEAADLERRQDDADERLETIFGLGQTRAA